MYSTHFLFIIIRFKLGKGLEMMRWRGMLSGVQLRWSWNAVEAM